MTKPLRELIAGLQYEGIHGSPDRTINRIVQDSRLVQPGDLFVAIKGDQHDGHKHIREALRNGAVAIVNERGPAAIPTNVTYITVKDSRKALAELSCALYDHPTRKLFTVGITGTKGKTTVAHLSAAVLGGHTELISTITNALKLGIDRTTPDAPELQRMAWEAVRSGKGNLVIEVSAHALSQERVRGVDFDVAVFTNLSHDHLDYYPDLESYLQAKLKLFAHLKPGATAILNLDDPTSSCVLEITRAQRLTYGLTPKADIFAEEIKLFPEGSQALVHTPQGSFRLNLHLPGIFSVQNALAAVGVGLVRGIPLALIKTRLEEVKHIEGRLEHLPARGGFTIVIDFAHSPDSLEKALQALKPFYHRLITVFGCGGDSDRLKRPIMGRISGQLSDYTIITTDNPKSEEPELIIREIEAGIRPLKASYEAIVDRKAAIGRALELANPGDCVLIAGKGHERTQIFKDHVIHFNDKAYLKELGVIALSYV